MKTYICDRCGKTFTMEEVTAIEKDFPTAYHVIDFEWVDVCPDCCAEFDEWWKKDVEPTK